ncbi:MAG: hypothetical protein FWF92_03410 [Oscillospiraceae bacterium]|nr:hypothetical protein [Oscillospiraceae bacterium]
MKKSLKNRLQNEFSAINEQINLNEKDDSIEIIFGTTYDDKNKTPIQILLIEREDFIELGDEGLTFKYLDEIFELGEEDVKKNVKAITDFYEVDIIEVNPIIDSYIIKKVENDSNILVELLKFHDCIGFLNAMKIFYV